MKQNIFQDIFEVDFTNSRLFMEMIKRIDWVFFDIGSTLVDEEEAYRHRIRDMIRGTSVSFEQFWEKRIEYAKKWGKGDELIPGARVETYKIMRESARKVLISNMSWKEIKDAMRSLRNDPFFREYYLKANDAPDHRDYVLKAPFPVMFLSRMLYKLKSKMKRA